MAFFIFILFIIVLIYFLKRKDKINKVNMKISKQMGSGNPGSNSTSAVTNPPIDQQPITSHQQRYEDRRLIERRRIHHKSSELHKLTQVKKYEIKKDDRAGRPYFPKSNKFYLDSREDDLEDYFDVERDRSTYGRDLNKNDEFDHDVSDSNYEWERNHYEYDGDTRNADFEQDRYEYENNDYGERDY